MFKERKLQGTPRLTKNAWKHSLPISQIDFLKNRVELWSRLASVVFIEEYGWSAHLQPQLLDSLIIIQRHQEELRVLLSIHRSHQREVLRESRIYEENSKALSTYNTIYTSKPNGLKSLRLWKYISKSPYLERTV